MLTNAGGIRLRDVIQDVVAEVAADELVLVSGLSRFDDDTVVRLLSRRDQKPEPLGFGLLEITALVTPVAWLAVDQVVRRLSDRAADSMAAKIKAKVRRLLRRKSAPMVIPPLSRDQLGEVRHQILALAAKRGVSEELAESIADAVVVRLVLAPDGDPPAAEG